MEKQKKHLAGTKVHLGMVILITLIVLVLLFFIFDIIIKTPAY